MRRSKKNLYLVAFIFSLLLHFSSAIVVYFKPTPRLTSNTIEITVAEPEKKRTFKNENMKDNAKQIVEQSDRRINDEKDVNAKYLSRFDQKVVQETKAVQNGKFQNDAKQGPAPKNSTTKSEQAHLNEKNAPKTIATHSKAPTMQDAEGLPTLAALKPQFHWDKPEVGLPNPGPVSQTDDHLKDVETGPQTLLSSREFVYYSYYSRIKDRLRIFWEPKIKEKVTRIFMSGRHIASNEDKITRLVITLDEMGKLIRVQVLGESGLKDLDDAAIEAFQQAAPFPNPPTGIVDKDRTIKIRWDFILEANSGIFQPGHSVAGNDSIPTRAAAPPTGD
jgi:TonB family protein